MFSLDIEYHMKSLDSMFFSVKLIILISSHLFFYCILKSHFFIYLQLKKEKRNRRFGSIILIKIKHGNRKEQSRTNKIISKICRKAVG